MTNIAVRGLMLGWALMLVAGCSSESACTDAGAAMDSFYQDDSNQVCKTDEDCVVVSTRCADSTEAFCGQLALSRTASESNEWKEISDDASADCSESCTTCDAQLVVHCEKGLCR